MKCWAKSIGNCDGKSLEHYVTKSIFSSGIVKVKGLHWCKEEKQVGLSGLGRKILCRNHNSLLSSLDSEAVNLMHALKYAVELRGVRSKLKPQKWSVHRKFINGPNIERWFLKTLINLSYDEKDKYIVPLEELADICYGKSKFKMPMGLYMAASKGDNISIDETFSMAPIWKDNSTLVGGIFEYAGFKHILALTNIDPYIKENSGTYRLKRYRFEEHGYNSLEVQFNW